MGKKIIHYKNWSIPIVYQDKDVIICDKPPQLLTTPISNSKADNLQDALISVFKHQTGFIRAAHRIDRYTSGIVVFAKTAKSHRHLFQQFRTHSPKRMYMAIVNGSLKKDSDTLVHHLKLVTDGFKNVITDKQDEEGKKAILTYRVRERFENHTLVEVELQTGLKNQIRAQFVAIGHPIFGEQQYADNHSELLDRQALHAWKITINSPSTGKPISVNASIPRDISFVLKKLRQDKTSDD